MKIDLTGILFYSHVGRYEISDGRSKHRTLMRDNRHLLCKPPFPDLWRRGEQPHANSYSFYIKSHLNRQQIRYVFAKHISKSLLEQLLQIVTSFNVRNLMPPINCAESWDSDEDMNLEYIVWRMWWALADYYKLICVNHKKHVLQVQAILS